MDNHLASHMEMALDSMHGMIVSTANKSIKNRLKSIVDGQKRLLALNLDNAKQGYVTEKTARDRALQQLVTETIGSTGYLYCIDSKGIIQAHPDSDLVGQDLSDYEFIKQQIKLKKGYLEYEWQNLKEESLKLKALYMDWFKPWDLIVSASCYKDEFPDVVNLKDVSALLSSVPFGGSGFAFILDTGKGEDITPDFQANPGLDKSLMKSTPLTSIGSTSRGITITQTPGEVEQLNPENSFKRKRVVHAHRTIPEYGWTIVIAAYPDEFDNALPGIRQVFFMTALISIILILVVTLWLSNGLQRPVREMVEKFEKGSRGNFSVRLDTLGATRELNLLAGHFNKFMGTFEHYTRELELKILELKDSKEKIRILAKFPDENPNPVLRISQDFCLVYMNQSAKSLVQGKKFFLGEKIPMDMAKTLEQKLDHQPEQSLGKPTKGFEFTIAGKIFFFTINRISDTQELYLHGLEITEKKNYEALLLLSGSVFDNSIEGITVTNADAIIQRVNRAFEVITGYSAKEVIGQNPRILKSDRHPPEFYTAMWRSLNETGQWNGEIWNRRKSGEPYPEWLSINAMHEDNGDVSGYVSICHDMTEIKKSEDKLKFNTYYDTLTKLPNRLLFEDRLDEAITAAKKDNSIVAVICLDFDNFKNVNQSLGLNGGDQLLKEAGQRISESFKEKITVSRFGGDQFNIILKNLAAPQAAGTWATRLMDLFKTPFVIQEKEIYVSISLGISLFPWDGNLSDVLIKNAEIAMHRTKETGKNSYSLFESDMNIRIEQRLELEAKLRQGLVKKEFKLLYQPKVSVKTGKITGMEALIRWYNDEKGLISPADFIPIAEETGIITPIGTWVLNEACSQTKAWQDLGFDNLKIAVNLSAAQFRNKGLLKTIQKALARSGLAPDSLNLEITESLVMNDVDSAIATMNEIADLGVNFSIDDFGTGYSSLAYLKRFPVSTLKVDRSFVREIPTNKNDMAIARTIISMAKSLNMTTVAEGVETGAQLKFMKENHCDEIQGYFFSPPVPPDQFLTLLEQDSKKPI
jgi:diguanylate cyclase (GGDEF)-like protein/PAS domain S-box-containing protein